jgi:hypothetical protein
VIIYKCQENRYTRVLARNVQGGAELQTIVFKGPLTVLAMVCVRGRSNFGTACVDLDRGARPSAADPLR